MHSQLQKLGSRFIVEENGPPAFEPRRRRITDIARATYLAASRLHTRRIYRRTAAVLVQSEGLRDQLLQEFGARKENVEVVPNAVDARILEQAVGPEATRRCRDNLGLSVDQTVLVYGGSLDRAHPMPLVVEAFLGSRAAKDGVRLIVMGTGFEQRRVRELAARAPESVELLTPQSSVRLHGYLHAADLSLAPYEGRLVQNGACRYSPLKVRESMAFDLAVAVSSGAQSDLIEDHVNGFLVNGNVGWRELFDELPARDRLLEMGAGNRGRVAHYTYDDVALRYVQVSEGSAA